MKKASIATRAKRHAIKKELAAPDFFEGALLGNGSLGVVACTRPDGVVFYFGHNNVWDIRIDESHKDKVGSFDEIWERIVTDKEGFRKKEWFSAYNREVTASYRQPYPRPYPASALFLFFDRKEYEVMGHVLDISNGLLTVTLKHADRDTVLVKAFVSRESDTLFCWTEAADGSPTELFYRLLLVPHTPDGGIPDYTVLANGFRQILPYNGFDGTPRVGVDRGFSVLYHINGATEGRGLDIRLHSTDRIAVQLTEGCYDEVETVSDVAHTDIEGAFRRSAAAWRAYWRCSGVALEDRFLEHLWYTNTYFIGCVLNQDCRCPGLFGNWMYKSLGTAWHGDYHMNYNTQQPFWGLMGANRQLLHMPYLRLVEELLPVSKSWARDFYHLDGACFPHSAYPVPMTVNPYPSMDWGWEIFETPWTVQSLWWHYTYTKDLALLRTRIYPLLREAAAFLVGYMTREGADPVGDGKYHLFPTIVPELYGLSTGLTKNLDGIADLTLTKFVLRAVREAARELDIEQQEAALLGQIEKILAAYPDYPTAPSRRGEVFVSVASEDPDNVVYNVPTNLMPIFPGEDLDAQNGTPEALEIARRSWKYHYNEGGNDLVFYNLAGARLGVLDLEKFKRHVAYCLLPNETATDRASQSGGRYAPTKELDFMSRMGIWIENFSLYAVIDECLIHGHTDVTVLFPCWDLHKKASFCSMRTKGAFLVDADCADGQVQNVHVYSEKGGVFRLKNPWKVAVDAQGNRHEGDVLHISMKAGDELLLRSDKTAPN